jgi:hypothetical protein
MKTPQELLSPAIIAARTPAQREQLAAELERIAALIRATAAAQRRQQTRPASERAAPRKKKAGPGRHPGDFVRIERAYERGRLRVYVGRALWYALGSPGRLDIQRLAGQVELRPATGDAGYAVISATGMPRMTCDGARDLLDNLEDGRYAAACRGNTIAVGARID